MTIETHDDLSMAIGRDLTNQEWIKIIAEGFHVSNSVAKEMLHAMYEVKKYKSK